MVSMFQLRVGVRLFLLQFKACLNFHGYIWVNLLNGKLGVMRDCGTARGNLSVGAGMALSRVYMFICLNK